LAYVLPCRRFALALTSNDARLGADVGRYSFIVVDLHHLLLAGLPAHHPVNTAIAVLFDWSVFTGSPAFAGDDERR